MKKLFNNLFPMLFNITVTLHAIVPGGNHLLVAQSVMFIMANKINIWLHFSFVYSCNFSPTTSCCLCFIIKHKLFKGFQPSTYEARNHTCMPLHTPKTLETCKKKSTPCLIKKTSRCEADRTSKTTTFFISHSL